MHRWRTWGIQVVILCFALIYSSSSYPVFAATPQTSPRTPTQGLNLQISPLPIELSAKPGTSVTSELRVRNSGTDAETLKATLKGVTTEGEDGHIVFHDLGPNDQLTQWVHLSSNVFNAPAGQWQSIIMTVNLPKTAAFGYYFSVQFELANPPIPKPGQAALQGAVDIFVLLNADAAGATRTAEITSFTADHKSYEFLPVSFSLHVHNNGNVHVAPHGNIFITRGNSQVGAITINSGLGNILPNGNRIFTASWADGFPVYTNLLDANGQSISNGRGKPKQHLVWNFSKVPKLRFGHYTAHLLLVYNDGYRDVPVQASVSFWVIPWRLVGGLLIIMIFVTIGFWSTIKKGQRFIKRPQKTKRAP